MNFALLFSPSGVQLVAAPDRARDGILQSGDRLHLWRWSIPGERAAAMVLWGLFERPAATNASGMWRCRAVRRRGFRCREPDAIQFRISAHSLDLAAAAIGLSRRSLPTFLQPARQSFLSGPAAGRRVSRWPSASAHLGSFAGSKLVGLLKAIDRRLHSGHARLSRSRWDRRSDRARAWARARAARQAWPVEEI